MISEHERGESFCSSDEVRALLAEQFTLVESTETSQGPARYWRLAEAANTRVGFISPHSHNFCATCNRAPDRRGPLVAVLGQRAFGRPQARAAGPPGDPDRLEKAIRDSLHLKPYRHHFEVGGDVQILRFMNMTGG